MTENSISTVKDKSLMSMYQEDVDVGLEEAGESLRFPQLKINNSQSKHGLASGKRLSMGMLYHTLDKEEFESVDCHIVYVGKYQLPDFTNPNELKMNYIIGAVRDSDNSPFVMYAKGFSLQSVWNFMDDIAGIKTKFKLPLYALKINVSTETRPHEKFKSVDVWNFKIKRTADGNPMVEGDQGRALMIKNMIPSFREAIAMMAKKGYKDDDINTLRANDDREPIKDLPEPSDPEPERPTMADDPLGDKAKDVSDQIPF